MKAKDFTRRDFIRTTGAVTAGVVLAPTVACSSSPFDPKDIPTTVLGKTGVTVPRMILGLGSRFMAATEDVGLQILETALNSGLYYWDTAAIYKNDVQYSEERVGKILGPIRDKVFLSTKVSDRKADDAKRTVETSLKRLNTDYINLYQVHSIMNEDEVKQFGSKDGVLPVLKKFQEEGVIRHIGFTGHTSASAMKLAAEMYDFDTMLIALNHQEQGKQPFEEQPVPYAAGKGMGVLCMKVIRPRETVNGLSPDDLIKYALTLKDVTACVIGTDSVEVLKKNINTLKNFEPLSDERMKELHVALDPFYRSKHLQWMQPNYYDGMHIA